MLRELRIKDFGLFNDETVEFSSGLNIISGDSGAGKSLVLQAVALGLGAKPKSQLQRKGKEEWTVELIFDLERLAKDKFAALPEIARSEELTISRSLNRSGKGKVYVNGRVGSISLLQEIGQILVNIAGQDEKLVLLEANNTLQILDAFAGNAELLQEYAKHREHFLGKLKHVQSVESDQGQVVALMTELSQKIAELESLKLSANRRKELEETIRSISNVEKTAVIIRNLNQHFIPDSDFQITWGQIQKEVLELAKLDVRAANLNSSVKGIVSEFCEIEGFLSKNIEVSYSAEELEGFREELADLARVERKYKTDCAGLMTILTEAKQKVSQLTEPQDLSKLRLELHRFELVMLKQAQEISARRQKAAKKLALEISREVTDLNMPSTRVEFRFESVPPGLKGIDGCQIFVSFNKGEELRELSKIASGGELSRLSLVLIRLLQGMSGVNILAFDEVDTGVSGKVAYAMGDKLLSISTFSQVICITHLPQVAAFGDKHFNVVKQESDQTRSQIRAISGDEKVDEIARMLAGYQITKASRESALELLSSKNM